MAEIRPIEWSNGKLNLLDQTRLPNEEVWLQLVYYSDVVDAIAQMRVRGAPAIGVAAAYAMAMAAREVGSVTRIEIINFLRTASEHISTARPTAVNASWAVKRMMTVVEKESDERQIASRLLDEARNIQREDEEMNRQMGKLGASLLPRDGGVLTHCNAGALATAGYGTAIGVIRAAWEGGKRFRVYATETRPFLQGARLTAWELVQLGIPTTVIVDSAAGLMMNRRQVQCVVVGADRIAANGDTANKIGTYSLAVLANENNIPFYVAAPSSTIDLSLSSGEHIPIEERQGEEVSRIGGIVTTPYGVEISNPAFDVTPNSYISAIITERCVVSPPYDIGLRSVIGGI